MENCGDDPSPNENALKRQFGEKAAEYARVRARAAEETASPDALAWKQAAWELQRAEEQSKQ